MAAAPGATTAAPPATGREAAGASFVRGSGEGRYIFEVQTPAILGGALGNALDVGPIDVKAYDYMRSILLKVETTIIGGGTTTSVGSKDYPFNIISYLRVKQPNGQTMYSVSNGQHAAMIQKYSLVRPSLQSDPRSDPDFVATAGTAPTVTFGVRIPFELDLRDALGALPNKDAAAPFTIELGLNSTSTIFSTAPVTAPTIKITPFLEAYDQPPETLDGKSVETTPPNMNTLQRWTEQSVTMVSGAFDVRVRKLGNYVRELLFLSKNSSGVRIVTPAAVSLYSQPPAGWTDVAHIVLDEDIKDNITLWLWQRDIWEIWGFGGLTGGATSFPANDTAGGFDDGVFPYQYCCNRDQPNVEAVAKYLPTIESEDYLLRGDNWGTSVSKMVILKCEVLPRGDIFGDA